MVDKGEAWRDRRTDPARETAHVAARMPGVLTLSLLLTLPFQLRPADAHHSFSIYTDEITEIEGELLDVHWGNPHVLLTVQVSESGEDTEWTLETGNPYVLERRGLPRELFQPGERIRAAGRVHRAQAAQLWLHNLMSPWEGTAAANPSRMQSRRIAACSGPGAVPCCGRSPTVRVFLTGGSLVQVVRSGSREWTGSPPAANRWGCPV